MNKIPHFTSFKNFNEIDALLTRIAEEYVKQSKELSIASDVQISWNALLQNWIADSTMPLFIRKTRAEYPKGSEIIHNTGRILIPTDNGPAHWAFSMAFNGYAPSLLQVMNEWIIPDRINIAMILSKSQTEKIKYRCTKHYVDAPNEKGWKIAHIKRIGINSKTKLEHENIDILKSHFLNFMDPGNMFLIPKKYSGIAESEIFLEHFSKGFVHEK